MLYVQVLRSEGAGDAIIVLMCRVGAPAITMTARLEEKAMVLTQISNIDALSTSALEHHILSRILVIVESFSRADLTEIKNANCLTMSCPILCVAEILWPKVGRGWPSSSAELEEPEDDAELRRRELTIT